MSLLDWNREFKSDSGSADWSRVSQDDIYIIYNIQTTIYQVFWISIDVYYYNNQ